MALIRSIILGLLKAQKIDNVIFIKYERLLGRYDRVLNTGYMRPAPVGKVFDTHVYDIISSA
jgi:hypothetical protein